MVGCRCLGNCHSTLRKIPEEHRSHLQGGGKLKFTVIIRRYLQSEKSSPVCASVTYQRLNRLSDFHKIRWWSYLTNSCPVWMVFVKKWLSGSRALFMGVNKFLRVPSVVFIDRSVWNSMYSTSTSSGTGPQTRSLLNHFYFPTNAFNCIKLIRLKSTCINILKDN